jgi:hypothetical protein
MDPRKPRARSGKRARRKSTRSSRRHTDVGVAAALGEIQRVLDTPLPQLMESDEERAAAEELALDAQAAPAMVRLAELVAFVGSGRPATQAGNLKAPDAVAAAIRLGTGDDLSGGARSMDDVPEVAHVFRWAIAAGLLAARGTKIVAGPRAQDLERDPLAAWFNVAITLLGRGLLDGFRRGWRKSYVELLDAGAGPILAAILATGGQAPLAAIDELVWERVAHVYDYDYDDAAERQHVVRLVKAMMTQFADIGTLTIRDGDVILTALGNALASAAAAMASDGDLE